MRSQVGQAAELLDSLLDHPDSQARSGINDACATARHLHVDLHGSLVIELQDHLLLLMAKAISKTASIILQVPSMHDDALLIRRDAKLCLDLGLDVVDGVVATPCRTHLAPIVQRA